MKTYITTEMGYPPIHPDYVVPMNPKLNIGDLVETYDCKLGIVTGYDDNDLNIHIYISGADNRYYVIMIGDRKKSYVGYSLKKIKKTLDK